MHSRIYQVSEKPVENFIGEERYDEYFVGSIADYVSEVEHKSDDYIQDLKWLQNATEGLKVNIKEGKFFKTQKTKRERSKKDTLKTFDLSEEKDVAQNKIFNKQKRTTKKFQIYEMTKPNFFAFDISQFSQLKVYPVLCPFAGIIPPI